MACALCGNTDAFEAVAHVDAKSSEPLRVSLCGHCGLVQQTPIPSTHELSIYYSHHYRRDYKNTYEPKAKHVYRAGRTAIQRINFLKSANITQGSLLDIGAGGGEFVYLSGKSGFRSQGVEPNIGYSEYAKHVYECDVTTSELTHIEGKYDVITLFHVLEHLPAPVKAFEILYGLLNHRGKLFIEVPWIETNDASPSNIFFKAHIFYFSVDTLISCASPFFTVLKVDTSANLKLLLEVKTIPESLILPPAHSVLNIKDRLYHKGWFEYLISGRGYVKPIKRLGQYFDEAKLARTDPKTILDNCLQLVL